METIRKLYLSCLGVTSPPPQREWEKVETVVKEMECLLKSKKRIKSGRADKVWPGLYIGDKKTAKKCGELRRTGFTHVVNCIDRVVGCKIYNSRGLSYMGIRARNTETFDISAYFKTTAEFIHSALAEGGKVLVHCHCGVSRSATIVLAYLMLKHNMTLVDAVNTVKKKRGIAPNRGFLRQLLYLQKDLHGWI